MFRGDRQVCDAIGVLLRSVRLQHLWTETGPTDRALELLADRGGPLSHGEALVLLAAFDFWNGQGKVELGEILAVLDGDRIELLGSLMLASSGGAVAVDRWLAEHRRGSPAGRK
jgi:hypothetical protein